MQTDEYYCKSLSSWTLCSLESNSTTIEHIEHIDKHKLEINAKLSKIQSIISKIQIVFEIIAKIKLKTNGK